MYVSCDHHAVNEHVADTLDRLGGLQWLRRRCPELVIVFHIVKSRAAHSPHRAPHYPTSTLCDIGCANPWSQISSLSWHPSHSHTAFLHFFEHSRHAVYGLGTSASGFTCCQCSGMRSAVGMCRALVVIRPAADRAAPPLLPSRLCASTADEGAPPVLLRAGRGRRAAGIAEESAFRTRFILRGPPCNTRGRRQRDAVERWLWVRSRAGCVTVG